jgi:hypothetical protein
MQRSEIEGARLHTLRDSTWFYCRYGSNERTRHRTAVIPAKAGIQTVNYAR